LLREVEDQLRTVRMHELHLSEIASIIGEKPNAGNPIFDTLLNFTDFHNSLEWEDNQVIRPRETAEEERDLEGGEMTNTLFDLEVSKTAGMFSIRIKYSRSW